MSDMTDCCGICAYAAPAFLHVKDRYPFVFYFSVPWRKFGIPMRCCGKSEDEKLAAEIGQEMRAQALFDAQHQQPYGPSYPMQIPEPIYVDGRRFTSPESLDSPQARMESSRDAI